MTDEEMAKDYAYNINGLEITCSLLSVEDKSHAYRLGRYDGFLAGLKEGKPKWHKVTDGDLPKEQKEYWCKVFFYELEETFNAFLWFDLETKDFKFLEEIKEGVESSFKVKKWCELPQMEDKE